VLVHEPEMMVVEKIFRYAAEGVPVRRYRLAYKRRVYRPLGAGKCEMTTALIAAEGI
jgi:CelD/BcsL family acetyltransferase involved in cellulose biosynthesis